MNLREIIEADLKSAMKAGDELKLSVLRLLNSAIRNKEIEKRSGGLNIFLNDEECLKVLSTEAKKRKEAAEAFSKGGRNDLKDKELNELEIIQKYLPAQLSSGDTEKLVLEILKKSAVSDFGQAMKAVLAELKGKADAKLVSEIIKKHLGN